MQTMKYETENCIMIALTGRWDPKDCQEIVMLFCEALYDYQPKVILDLSRLSYFEERGIELVDRFQGKLTKQHRALTVV